MKYNSENLCIEMSVRELCAIACPEGDIDCRDAKSLYERGAQGSAIHRQIQKSYGDDYHAEVAFKNTSKLSDIYFYVTGRADGIIYEDGVYIVDEIKTVSSFAFSDAASGFHIAQLFCYSYFFCLSKSLMGVDTRLTYYNTTDGEIRYSQRYVTLDDLRDYYMGMLECAYRKASFLRDKYEKRKPTARACRFPYRDLRESQEEMIHECYLDIKQGSRLFCQAPTGIGKTISVIYPSVRLWGEDKLQRIFYLTSKASIKKEAYNAARLLRESGAEIYTCSLSSKEYMCICPESERKSGRVGNSCRPDVCKFANKYYSKKDGILHEMLENEREFNRDVIMKYAQKYEVCPYELSLDLSEYCDLIICDYNYVFSPLVYLRRYFDAISENYVFLVDEAHNLPQRARDTFSTSLKRSDFLHLAHEALYEYKNGADAVSRCASDIVEIFDGYREEYKENIKGASNGVEYGYGISKEPPYKLIEKVSRLYKICENWQKNNLSSPLYSLVDDINYKLHEVLTLSRHYDDGYISFVNIAGDEISMLLYCLDPSNQLDCVLSRAYATVMFSATLTPAEYYADILGGGENAVSVSFPSPFPKENLCVAVMDGVSTRYDDREASYKRIASSIAATVSAKAGNYIAFFPSYDYMEKVYSIFEKKYPKVKTRVQKRNMSQGERERFLDFFENDENKLRIGFCVIGGSFSEGIDLPGKRLIGSIVIGVGMPGISDTNNILREYYDEKCSEGYDYAYTYPGFNNVLQAVGRVIRNFDDVGIAVLIDDRYAEPKYRRLFPYEWRDAKYAGNPQSLAEIARRFWNKEKN